MSVSSHLRPVTRFAPSPTGALHLGHAYAALIASNTSVTKNGSFLLRFEDIDLRRSKREFERAILEDISWLGIKWQGIALRQSKRLDVYARAIDTLYEQGLLYPCFCTRKDIAREISAAGAAPHGPHGLLYPGTCRQLGYLECKKRIEQGSEYAFRLNMSKASARTGQLTWTDTERGEIIADPEQFGDVVLGRKDFATSYHLSVVIDDHFQGITLVTRGKDLFAATHVHRLLQALLSLDTPDYLHHKLIMGQDGKKLSKRDQSLTLRALREEGNTPTNIFELLGVSPASQTLTKDDLTAQVV